MKKDRGIFLTIMLIFLLIALLKYIPSLPKSIELQKNTEFINNLYINLYIPFKYLRFSIALVSIWGMWIWKKWAVYLFFIHNIVGFGMLFMAQQDKLPHLYQITIMSIVINILTTGLWLWAIYRKWKYFE